MLRVPGEAQHEFSLNLQLVYGLDSLVDLGDTKKQEGIFHQSLKTQIKEKGYVSRKVHHLLHYDCEGEEITMSIFFKSLVPLINTIILQRVVGTLP